VASPRLLYVGSSFPFGKNDTFFAAEFAGLRRLGIDVRAIPVRPRGELTTVAAGDVAVRRPLLDGAIALAAVQETLRAPRTVARAVLMLFRSPSPNVLVRNLVALPKALWLGRQARNGSNHIHALWAGPPATVAMIASMVSGVPWSFTGHSDDLAAENLLPSKFESAAFVRFIARAWLDRALTNAPHVDHSRWVLLHLGIDVPADWTPPPPPGDPAVVLMSARISPEKRHDTLVRATRLLIDRGRSVEVWLAGWGDGAAAVETDVQRAGLTDVVKFLGYVPNHEIRSWLASHRVDIVVLPSDSEGLPYSLIEALAYGVPAVASAVGGVGELLGDGCGELIGPGDAVGLADAIDRYLESSDHRASCADAGRARVEREFSAEIAAQTMAELCRLLPDAG